MMPRHPSVLVVSVVAHLALLAAALVLSVLAPDALPLPRTLLAWSPARTVHLDDIPLPRSTPSTARTSVRRITSTASPQSPVPLTAPDRLPADPGAMTDGSFVVEPPVEADGRGVGDVTGLGVVETAIAPPPKGPVRLHSGMQAPVRIADAAPRYPELARRTRTEGRVIIEAIIDERGEVVSMRLLHSIPLLDQAALDAVQRWRFRPGRLNGDAVSVIMTVTVNFTLAP